MPSERTGTAVERLLDDPIVELLLTRDGLTRADVLTLMDTVRKGLHDQSLGQAA